MYISKLIFYEESFEETKQVTGISCLSESDSSLLMWAHYANNHKGMCVEYELLQISEQLKFSPIPVIYTDGHTPVDGRSGS